MGAKLLLLMMLRDKKFQSHANCKPPLKSQHLQLNKFKKL